MGRSRTGGRPQGSHHQIHPTGQARLKDGLDVPSAALSSIKNLDRYREDEAHTRMANCAGFVVFTSPMLRTLFNFPGEGVSPLRRRSRSLILASLLFPLPKMLTDAPMPGCCSDNSIGARTEAVHECSRRHPTLPNTVMQVLLNIWQSLWLTHGNTILYKEQPQQPCHKMLEHSRPRLACASIT